MKRRLYAMLVTAVALSAFAIAFGTARANAGRVHDPGGLRDVLALGPLARDGSNCTAHGPRVLAAGLRRAVMCHWGDSGHTGAFHLEAYHLDAAGRIDHVTRRVDLNGVSDDSAVALFSGIADVLMRQHAVRQPCPAPQTGLGPRQFPRMLREARFVGPRFSAVVRAYRWRSTTVALQVQAIPGSSFACPESRAPK